jgi:hypothetical protein
MNEQLQAALSRLIDTLIKSIDGVTGQVPDLVRQLIEYQAFRTVLYMLWFGLLIVISVMYLLWYGYKIVKNKNEDWSESQDLWGVGLAFISGIAILCAGYNLVDRWIDYVQLTRYPNAWVLDYLRSMIK